MVKLIRFLTLFLISMPVLAEHQYNMTRGVTPLSNEIYNLHMIIFWICVVIGIGVFGVMFYSIFKHRKSKGAVASKFHEHPILEVVWAVIPFLILVAMAVPATKVLLHLEDTSEAEITVKITGYQWKWKYDYLDEGISFFSNISTPPEQRHHNAEKGEWYLLEVDNPLVLPINKKVRFLLTSNDVIHSWWVPALGLKKDAIPGFIHEIWATIEEEGTYRGQCAELCGVGHGFMPIVVEAKSEKEYKAWLNKKSGEKKAAAADALKPMTKEELIEKGKIVYATSCALCHKEDGTGMLPAFPAIKGGKVSVGPIDKHMDTVVKGVNGTAMQAFGEQLTDLEIAAVITYERNAFGNDDKAKYGKQAGGLVQPTDIK